MKHFTLILTVILLMMTSIGAKAQDISYEHCVAVDVSVVVLSTV